MKPSVETRLAVRVTPRAGQDRLLGWRDGVLWAQVAAPPADGQANEALLRMLARTLDVPVASLRFAAGQRSRQKLVAVEGLSRDEVQRRLGG